MSGICGYGFSEFIDKLDGIVDEESKCLILALEILVAVLYKEMDTHFDMLL